MSDEHAHRAVSHWTAATACSTCQGTDKRSREPTSQRMVCSAAAMAAPSSSARGVSVSDGPAQPAPCFEQKPPGRQASTSPQSQQPPPDENIQKSCPSWSACTKQSWQTAQDGSMPHVRQWYTMSPVFHTTPHTPGVAARAGGDGAPQMSNEHHSRPRERGSSCRASRTSSMASSTASSHREAAATPACSRSRSILRAAVAPGWTGDFARRFWAATGEAS
eukprot:scaffold2988_cov123-Isochrysis_galbana.AAC.6